MKKTLLILVAATTIVACSETETLNEIENETELIGFKTNHENITRASVNSPADLTTANGGFGVYGFKHLNNRTASNGAINLSDDNPTSSENYVSTIFDNVKVWYVQGATTKDFTYAVPRYWDVKKFYTFFAYAPHASKADATANPAVKGISFDQATGKFTRNDVLSIQDASNVGETATVNSASSNHYTTADETSIVDYLFGSYVPSQKKGSTNQESKDYTGKELTVGFTFAHILSKLNVTVKAEQSDDAGFHNYSGIQDIKVTKLSISNLPTVTAQDVVYSQTAVTSAEGTFTPASWNTTLDIINTANGANATSTAPLYVLYGGSISGETITNPATFWDQSFHYFITPNAPANSGHYNLDLDYTITYVDGTVEPYTRSIDLYQESASFASMAQANVYNIVLTIALNQIYLTVDATGNWTENNTNVDVE